MFVKKGNAKKWEEILEKMKSDARKLTIFDATILGLVILTIILGVLGEDEDFLNMFSLLEKLSQRLVSALVSTSLPDDVIRNIENILVYAIVATIFLIAVSPLVFNLGIAIVLIKEVTPTIDGVRLYLDVFCCHLISLIYVCLDFCILKVTFEGQDYSMPLGLSLAVLRLLVFAWVGQFWMKRWDCLEKPLVPVPTQVKTETV